MCAERSAVSFLRNQTWDFRLVSDKTGEKNPADIH